MQSLRLTVFLCAGLVLLSWPTRLHAQTAPSPGDSMLLGKITRADLVNRYSWFNERYQTYHTKKSVVKQLRSRIDSVSFVVILGTWCSDSREHVPAFFKLIDQLGIPENRIALYGVNRKKDRILPAELGQVKLEYVPTFILYKQGMEIGRIVEDTKVSMEKDMLHLLSGKQ